MQAMVFTKPGVVEMLDVAEPVPDDGDVIVEVACCGICGSELHGIASPGFRTPPLVMGHEFAGTLADGRRVVANPILSCGECDMCRLGRPQVCRVRQIVGIHRAGAFAERVAVPERCLHDLPDDLSWAQGAMVEPLANGLHAWARAGAPAGARVGVIGAGTIGLVCLLAALDGGASEVVMTDLSPRRLEVAASLGATTAATGLEDEFDVVIDAVGAPATHAASVARLRPDGTAVWIGLISDAAAFDARALVRQEQRVVGSFAYTDDEFADAVSLADRVDLSWAHEHPLGDGAELFTSLMNGRDDVVKVLLTPDA